MRRGEYANVRKVGAGAFGEVQQALCRSSGEYVAVKTVRVPSGSRGYGGRSDGDDENGAAKALYRELESLRQLAAFKELSGKESYVVRFLDFFIAGPSSLSIVLEFLPVNLQEVIQAAPAPFSRSVVKTLAFMMLSALGFCHEHNIIHRDVKPSNMLLGERGVLKLCDFGLARVCREREDRNVAMSPAVCTRWYRPPELLFAATSYDCKVDVWGAGCVLAEIIGLRPLCPGAGDIGQMFKVFQLFGTPDPCTWPKLETYADFSKISFPKMQPVPLELVLPQANRQDLRFLELLLQLNPADRLSAKDALDNDLNGRYFDRLSAPSLIDNNPQWLASVLAAAKNSGAVSAKEVRHMAILTSAAVENTVKNGLDELFKNQIVI